MARFPSPAASMHTLPVDAAPGRDTGKGGPVFLRQAGTANTLAPWLEAGAPQGGAATSSDLNSFRSPLGETRRAHALEEQSAPHDALMPPAMAHGHAAMASSSACGASMAGPSLCNATAGPSSSSSCGAPGAHLASTGACATNTATGGAGSAGGVAACASSRMDMGRGRRMSQGQVALEQRWLDGSLCLPGMIDWRGGGGSAVGVNAAPSGGKDRVSFSSCSGGSTVSARSSTSAWVPPSLNASTRTLGSTGGGDPPLLPGAMGSSRGLHIDPANIGGLSCRVLGGGGASGGGGCGSGSDGTPGSASMCRQTSTVFGECAQESSHIMPRGRGASVDVMASRMGGGGGRGAYRGNSGSESTLERWLAVAAAHAPLPPSLRTTIREGGRNASSSGAVSAASTPETSSPPAPAGGGPPTQAGAAYAHRVIFLASGFEMATATPTTQAASSACVTEGSESVGRGPGSTTSADDGPMSRGRDFGDVELSEDLPSGDGGLNELQPGGESAAVLSPGSELVPDGGGLDELVSRNAGGDGAVDAVAAGGSGSQEHEVGFAQGPSLQGSGGGNSGSVAHCDGTPGRQSDRSECGHQSDHGGGVSDPAGHGEGASCGVGGGECLSCYSWAARARAMEERVCELQLRLCAMSRENERLRAIVHDT
eukprot:jgi/Mesvir1/838/Mv17416-RA.2